MLHGSINSTRMKRILTIAITVLLALLPASARHSKVIREDVTPVRIMQVQGDVTDSHLLLRPGTGQALNSAAGCCRMKTVPGNEASILFDFGQEMHGGIRVVTGAFKKSNIIKVRIRFGESVSEACSDIDGENGATNDHAIRDFEAELPFMGVREFGNTGFRFVRIDLLDKGKEIDFNLREVSGISIGSDDPLIGSFKCSEQRLNDIWNVGARTIKLNMQDYIWDGIKRDRLVWIGDMYPEVMTVFSTFGDTDIITKSLDQARDVYPLPGYMYGISSYSVWWMMIQREWYRHYGNYEYLKEQRNYLTGLLEQLISSIDENGNEHLPERRFLDWPSNVNEMAEDCGLHALMMMAMDCGAELCETLGEKQLAMRCLAAKARMENAAPAIAETYFKSGIAADQPGMKQAAALMSLAGMTDPVKAGELILQKGGHGFSTFYGYFMLEALASVGRYTEAMDIISQYWGGMLDLGATSFWEDFDLDWLENAGRIDEFPQPGKVDVHKTYGKYCYIGYRHSLCHGWAAGPVAWMSRHVLGIVPEGIGQNVICIDPHLGSLEWAEGTWPSPYGIVSVRAEKTADGRILARVNGPKEIRLKAGSNVTLVKARR